MFSFLKQFDWKLNIAVLFLIFMSLLELFGAHTNLFWKQLAWFGIGIIVFLVFAIIDWRAIASHKGIIVGLYVLAIFLLAATLVLARNVRGHRSWISLGPFDLQSSVFAGLALIVALANFFRKMHVKIAYFSSLIYSFVYFLILAAFVALQGDMASMLVLFSIWLGFVLVSGISKKQLLILVVIFALAGFGMWSAVLKNYQKERISGLFFPNKDVLGINYNVIQAKIAIGSGGLFGKGFKQGTQVQLGFLPESQTDFIFAAITEEWGLVAAFLIICAFLLIIARIIKIGSMEAGNFGKYICLGAAIFLLANFIFNTGSNIGFMPVMGIPFPFLSYGGSHLIIEMMLLGMVQSIKTRKL